PGNHSVTESSFATPCKPINGGFDSGFISAEEAEDGRFRTWNYTVTNDQKPLWFFCRQQTPLPHCHAGMVGVINVQTAPNTFERFQAKAEGILTNSPTSTVAPVSAADVSDRIVRFLPGRAGCCRILSRLSRVHQPEQYPTVRTQQTTSP
ncbi:hypothetical protein FB451DRAFT_1053866, partial [Mycena latifolia]